MKNKKLKHQELDGIKLQAHQPPADEPLAHKIARLQNL
jgi:hypothetical protein